MYASVSHLPFLAGPPTVVQVIWASTIRWLRARRCVGVLAVIRSAPRRAVCRVVTSRVVAACAQIERGLRVRVKNVCLNWGLEIMSVELLEITPTPSIQAAMHKQLAAERIRCVVTATTRRPPGQPLAARMCR